jgi:hypothetical protein
MTTTMCVNGHMVLENQRFCPQCGAPVGKQEAPAEAPEGGRAFPSETRRSRTPLLTVGIAGAVVIIGLLVWLVLSSRGGPAGPLAEKHDIHGTLNATLCDGGYDIEGANVEVRDENDKLIGSATTGFDSTPGSGGCTVPFTARDVPKASFYQITIGTHGGPTYTYQEMQSENWNLTLTLS